MFSGDPGGGGRRIACAAGDSALDAERVLQVSLEQTTVLRAEFEAAFKGQQGDDLRALYTAWTDRIGANRIIATLKRVEPSCHGRGHDLGTVIYE